MSSKNQSSKKPSDNQQNSPFNHLICILLSLISTLFLFLVILYNIPFSNDNDNYNEISNLNKKLWLIKFDKKNKIYGFSIWGWCSWSSINSNSNSNLNFNQNIICKRKTFWKLPEDFQLNDSVNLPNEISKSLSISGFFLTFLLITSFAFLIDLLITIKFHSPKQPPSIDKIYWTCPRKMRYTTWLAYCLRNFYLRILASIFILAWGLPVIIISSIGVNKFNKNSISSKLNDESMSLGSGWAMSLTALICLIIIQIIIPLGGLWNDARRSGKKH
ncbi:uncharacterized protein I206_101013 [Kwoniella pini CBS 10737]|uniref:Uncharacterized protein n=1 Tax=Kwoniella pini CBS 10737 TaxID=1296096 RepID=A0A1B9IBI2_9TREE|nr:uncharacterized protein I206_00313 [Kwoniella pini CBS 10737]OCF53012.1 hypothetical protein I206_00313 [Kwoniella pini CBS 10737]